MKRSELSIDWHGGDTSSYEAALNRMGLSMKSEADQPLAGREGTSIAPQIYKGRTMAVFTSGGDASGTLFFFNIVKTM